MNNQEIILTAGQARRKIRRMALEIAERNASAKNLTLIGIRENGFHIAQLVATFLSEFYSGSVQVEALTINKRDPLKVQFANEEGITGNTIILIDDVANSGRTMLYATQPLLAFMPASIQTLALVERTHKQFPVFIHYTGISVSTTKGENITVIIENGEVKSATLESE